MSQKERTEQKRHKKVLRDISIMLYVALIGLIVWIGISEGPLFTTQWGAPIVVWLFIASLVATYSIKSKGKNIALEIVATVCVGILLTFVAVYAGAILSVMFRNIFM